MKLFFIQAVRGSALGYVTRCWRLRFPVMYYYWFRSFVA